MLVRMELSKRGNLLGGVCMTCVHLYHYNTQKDRLELKCVIHIKNKQLNLERQRVLSISVKKNALIWTRTSPCISIFILLICH